jgi:phage tail tape-measure protein
MSLKPLFLAGVTTLTLCTGALAQAPNLGVVGQRPNVNTAIQVAVPVQTVVSNNISVGGGSGGGTRQFNTVLSGQNVNQSIGQTGSGINTAIQVAVPIQTVISNNIAVSANVPNFRPIGPH